MGKLYRYVYCLKKSSLEGVGAWGRVGNVRYPFVDEQGNSGALVLQTNLGFLSR